MTNVLLNSVSFGALDLDKQKELYGYLFEGSFDESASGSREIYDNRASLAFALVDAERRLNQTNAALFPFLSADQKEALKGELLLALYQLFAQYKLDWVEHQGDALPSRKKQIEQCVELLYKLSFPPVFPEETAQLDQEIAGYEKHTKYLGLKLVVPILIEQIRAISSGSITSVKEGLTALNERRLYWVWGGSTIDALLTMLSASFADTSTATLVLKGISPIAGSISWILYFTRAGLEWSLLAGHTFEFAMSEEERKLGVPWNERFTTQWNIRKYRLLNDSIWGLCNLACFTLLAASGPLAYWGNALTAVLLLMDVSLTWWRSQEEEAAHRVNLGRYDTAIGALDEKIKQQDGDLVLLEARADLYAAKKKAEFEWKYKRLATTTDLVYSVSLIAAFCMLCCFFFPPAAVVPATALILGVVGTTLCFVFNLVYASTNMALDVWKSKELKGLADHELEIKLNDFIGFLSGDPGAKPEDRNMKQLYLTLRELRVESQHQQDVITYQRYQVFSSTIRDALIPPLFIAAFVFMPLGIGIPIFALGMALAVTSYFMLASWKKRVEEKGLPEFDEDAYRDFFEKAKHQDSKQLLGSIDAKLKQTPSPDGFFSQPGGGSSEGSDTPLLGSP